MTWRVAMPLVALATGGCTWGEHPTLQVTSVSPVTTTRGVKTIVTVTGEGFAREVVVDLDKPARYSACTGLRVELRAPGQRPVPAPVPLRDAWAISPTTLRARLDGDAGKALWDVVVIDAAGGEVALPGALDVTNCGSANAACDDGEPCTFDPVFTPDQCTGNSACGGSMQYPDGSPCPFACVAGGTVAGSCNAGVCVPDPGLCEPPAACTGT